MFHSFYKNVGRLFSGSVIAQGIAFGFIPILSRIYTPEDFGILAVFMSFLGLFSILSTARYDQAVMLPENDKQAFSLLVLSQIINVAVAFLLSLLILLFGKKIAMLMDTPELTNALYYLPVSVACMGVIQAFQVWLNRKKYYPAIAWNKIAQNGSISTSRLMASPYSLGLIIGTMVGFVVTAIHILWISVKDLRQIKNISWSVIKSSAKNYRQFPRWALPSAFINNLSIQAPVFLITKFFSKEITGYFSNAVRLVFVPLSFVSGSVSQVYYEQAARNKSNPDVLSDLTRHVLIRLFWIGIIPISVLIVFGDILVPVFLGKDWVETGVYIRYLSLFYFVFYLISPLTFLFEVFNTLRSALVFNIILLAGRSASIWIGYYFFRSVDISILCLAASGIFIWLGMFMYVNRFIKLPIIPLIVKAVVVQATILIFLFLIRYLIIGYV